MAGCSGKSGPAPLDNLRNSMKNVPDWSILLDDMKVEGNFFKSYYHKYTVVTGETKNTTDWLEVRQKTYDQYKPYLGMTLWTKSNGKEEAQVAPPGYGHVGNSRYGRWQTDSSGRSFWVYYGQYRLFSDLMGGRRIYRDSYDTYSTYRTRGRPYFGRNNEYGTAGTYTRQQKPSFYKRRMARSASFSSKVQDRIGRTMTSSRSRSRSSGK